MKRCSVTIAGTLGRAEQVQGVNTLCNVSKLNKITVMPTVTALNASDCRTSLCIEQFRMVILVFVSAILDCRDEIFVLHLCWQGGEVGGVQTFLP